MSRGGRVNRPGRSAFPQPSGRGGRNGLRDKVGPQRIQPESAEDFELVGAIYLLKNKHHVSLRAFRGVVKVRGQQRGQVVASVAPAAVSGAASLLEFILNEEIHLLDEGKVDADE